MNKFKTFEIRWKESVGLKECPYMTRWVLTLFGYSLRLHHWINSDDQRYYHDHPYWMLILILNGSYTDISPHKTDTLTRWSVRLRKATHKHKVKVDMECWSLLITGKVSRKFGFYIPGRTKLMRPLRFFSRYGHNPCETENYI